MKTDETTLYTRVVHTMGPGPKFGPLPDFLRFEKYALNLGLWALSKLMTTIRHRFCTIVQRVERQKTNLQYTGTVRVYPYSTTTAVE